MTLHDLEASIRTTIQLYTDAGPRAGHALRTIMDAVEEYTQGTSAPMAAHVTAIPCKAIKGQEMTMTTYEELAQLTRDNLEEVRKSLNAARPRQGAGA